MCPRRSQPINDKIQRQDTSVNPKWTTKQPVTELAPNIMWTTTYHTLALALPNDITLSYARAGTPSNPTLLLHGFPSSSN